MVLKIYEFSRGIKVSGTPDNWHSQGFTGELMNCTFNPVPEAIKTAISNRLFAVAERGATDIPALVGREVEDEHGQWSVMAVVTRGRDDGGRPFSAYRYFWCEGSDKLVDIAHWWTMQSKNERDLIFDPFDVPEREIVIEDKQKYSNREHDITDGNFGDLTDEMLPVPVIVDFDRKITPVIVDRIATKKVGNNLLAWAYNVEALEAPRSFQVILPASQQAEEAIRRVVNSQSQVGNALQDEPAIKKAISLLSQNKVKPEHLKTIEDALVNPVIDDKYWRSMFDSQGASDAMKQGNYGHSMIRLLTLQAMVLPETLLSFLNWLAKRGKQKEQYDISNDFQAKVLGHGLKLYPKIEEKIYRGTQIIILMVKDNDELIETVARLLTFNHGVWHHVYRSDFQDEFESVIKGKLRWDHQWTRIASDIRGKPGIDKDYLRIAKLFVEIKDPVPAALFYYLGCGLIPRWLFNDLAHFRTNQYYIKIYGFSIQREISSLEYIWLALVKIGMFEMRVYLYAPLLILAILGSAFATYFGADRWFKTKAYNSSLEIITGQVMGQEVIKDLKEKPDRKKISQAVTKVLIEGLKENQNTTPIQQLSCQVVQEIDPNNKCAPIPPATSTSQPSQVPPLKPDDSDINATNKNSLEKIIIDLKSKLPAESQKSGEKTIKDEIFEIIKKTKSDIPNFDFIYSKSRGNEAIKSYQQSKNLTVDGKMDTDGETARKLKCDVVKQLGKEYFPNPVSDCN
jgi:hypothetical protein